jgi:hypothetical protein
MTPPLTVARNYGFTGAYSSVKRFLRRHREKEPATIILDFQPGEAAQVDFGAGPALVDAETGEVIKTWFFVMTLAYSRHNMLNSFRIKRWRPGLAVIGGRSSFSEVYHVRSASSPFQGNATAKSGPDSGFEMAFESVGKGCSGSCMKTACFLPEVIGAAAPCP